MYPFSNPAEIISENPQQNCSGERVQKVMKKTCEWGTGCNRTKDYISLKLLLDMKTAERFERVQNV